MTNPQHQPSPELRGRFLAAAARTPASRPFAWRRRLIGAVVAALVLAAGAAALMRARADWDQLPAGPLVATFGGLLAVVVAAATSSLSRGRSMVGAGTERLLAVSGLGVAVLLVLVLAVDPCGPSTHVFSGAELGLRALRCDLIVVTLGLVLLGLGALPLRGMTLGRPGLTGACLGLAAATLAHAVVRFHCGIGGPGHALLGHLLPALPLMAVGAWILARRNSAPSLEEKR
ncbi:MAG TPA: NrsF family protein [Polyangia bacterium]|jgi:hypothetical protein|nr:NrsF family protein [Polyangia bacterium]